MKLAKRLGSLLIAAALLLTITGCHGKNEVAATSGDIEFTSAFYMCALINADMEARSKVDTAKSEAAAEDTSSTATSSEATDYYKETVEEKTFSNWVKDTALEKLRRFAYVETKCRENNLTVSDEEKANYESYAGYYWNNYGYSTLFEPNGVSYDTYKSYMLYSAYEDLYFDFLYGTDGEKAINETDMSAFLNDNYVIANMLDASFSELDESAIADLQADFADYEKRLKNGEDFAVIYKEYKGTSEETETTDDTAPQPKDKLAQVLGSSETSNANEYFDTVKAMAVGEVKLVTLDNSAGLLLIKKGDIAADSYYFENMKDTLRYDLKYDEFDAAVKEAAAQQQLDVSAYATGRFKVKSIKYPEAQS